MTARLTRLFVVALPLALLSTTVAGQQVRDLPPVPQTAPQLNEAQLLEKIAAEPQAVPNYLDLVKLYVMQGRLDDADRMLRSAQAALARQRAAAGLLPAAPPETTRQPLPYVAGTPVRVGSTIQEPKKIRDVRPIYPAVAQANKVTGLVICEVVIDEQGNVADTKVLRSVPLLDEAAVDAVRQWKFTPTLLNGAPVPIIMTVTVSFTLTGK